MLQELQPSFCNMRAMIRADISKNELKALPENVSNLKSLQLLDASINKLTGLPASLFQCPQLSSLELKDNALDRTQVQEMPGFKDFWERRQIDCTGSLPLDRAMRG